MLSENFKKISGLSGNQFISGKTMLRTGWRSLLILFAQRRGDAEV